jgi:hypothetical protein
MLIPVMLKLILIMLVISNVVIVVLSLVPAGKMKLPEKVPTPPALPTTHPNTSQEGIDQFQFAKIILMLTLFGVGGLLFILN